MLTLLVSSFDFERSSVRLSAGDFWAKTEGPSRISRMIRALKKVESRISMDASKYDFPIICSK
jgi:hypothetical protein